MLPFVDRLSPKARMINDEWLRIMNAMRSCWDNTNLLPTMAGRHDHLEMFTDQLMVKFQHLMDFIPRDLPGLQVSSMMQSEPRPDRKTRVSTDHMVNWHF